MMTRRALVFWTACAGIAPLVSASGPVIAAGDAAPKASRVFTVDGMRVERYGIGSPAMIFVPGLACGSWVWDDAVKTYAGKHAVYTVTLAGFDGLPAQKGAALDAADTSLLKLIDEESSYVPSSSVIASAAISRYAWARSIPTSFAESFPSTARPCFRRLRR